MNTEQKILAMLSKFEKAKGIKKENLKSNSKNYKFSLIEELESDADYFDEQLSTASYYAYEQFDVLLDQIAEFQSNLSMEVDNLMVNSGVSSIVSMAEEKLVLLEKLETSANDLGIDASELYPDYETLKSNVMSAKETMDAFYSKYDEVVKESGFLTDFSR